MGSHFRRQGHKINRKRVQRLMRLMGIEAIYPKPNTSRPHPEHKIYPYLLRDLTIDRPNQVWATDITYVPMARGFMYLVAIMDWHSRKILSWRISNTLDADFCVDAFEEALDAMERRKFSIPIKGHSLPARLLPDLSRTTELKSAWTAAEDVQDNIFIERLWWTIKYHYLYLHSFDGGSDLRQGLSRWLRYYNQER